MILAYLLFAASLVAAHGHHEVPVDGEADWMTKHMSEEHHLAEFDDSSFFVLHDFNADGVWQPDEMLRTYGLMDESNRDVTPERRAELAAQLSKLLDTDGDGVVSRDEWLAFRGRGGSLPDLGTGPGHHGDDEYEYEIHHWEKYHDDDTTLEELTHPEDIEHFRKHAEMEAAEARREADRKQNPLRLDNIPSMFRPQS